MSTRWKPNVTVAAIVERDGRFLLVEEQTRDGLLLNNPAGHLDRGESPLQGVVREVLEETGCEFTPDAFLGFYMSRFRRTRTGEDPGSATVVPLVEPRSVRTASRPSKWMSACCRETPVSGSRNAAS